jgi:hypothetical protein
MGGAPSIPLPKVVHLGDYVPAVGAGEIAELHALAARLGRRTVKMINSTSVGGGVAEILNRSSRSWVCRPAGM